MNQASTENACRGTNRRGEPCGRRATRDGWCIVHHPEGQDMRAAGQLGGKASVRSRLGLSDEVADDSLRARARARLERLLNSENEQVALRASAALYSYRAQAPPSDEAAVVSERLHKGKVVSLAGLLALAVFEVQGAVDAELADVILRSAERVRELEAAGQIAPAPRAEPVTVAEGGPVPPAPSAQAATPGPEIRPAGV